MRGGFTLIELLLALSLTVIVIGLITWSIQIHLTALDKRRNRAEEAQLAQAILRRIASDLQNVVTRETIDLSALDNIMVSPDDLAGLVDGADGSDGADGASSGGADPSDAPDMPSEEELDALLGGESSTTEDLAGAETLPPEPGIFGNQYELQIDVGRTPRIDEYLPEMSTLPGQLHDIPSAVKSVTYYVRSQATGGAGLLGGAAGSAAAQTGLIRRSLDRAITEWAGQTTSLSLQSNDQVWAPEVMALEFHYFDGTDWVTEWDSNEQGLPVAVEIMLWLQPQGVSPSGSLAPPAPSPATGLGAAPAVANLYRLVVRLPQVSVEESQSAEEVPEGEGDAAESSGGADAAPAGGSAGGSPSGPAGGAGGAPGGGR